MALLNRRARKEMVLCFTLVGPLFKNARKRKHANAVSRWIYRGRGSFTDADHENTTSISLCCKRPQHRSPSLRQEERSMHWLSPWSSSLFYLVFCPDPCPFILHLRAAHLVFPSSLQEWSLQKTSSQWVCAEVWIVQPITVIIFVAKKKNQNTTCYKTACNKPGFFKARVPGLRSQSNHILWGAGQEAGAQ